MDSLDGMLMVPPERGQILGRAVWKVWFYLFCLFLSDLLFPWLNEASDVVAPPVAICRCWKTDRRRWPQGPPEPTQLLATCYEQQKRRRLKASGKGADRRVLPVDLQAQGGLPSAAV